MADELIISSDSHVFEPPDLWLTRIDAGFRDRAPRVGDVDHPVVDEQTIAGIGLMSNTGARFEAPETISDHRRFDDVHRGGYVRRNVFLTFQEDAVGIRLRDAIGVDTMMWGSDYLYGESTFPRSCEILDRILAGILAAERAKIVEGNAARFSRFDLARLAGAAA